MLRIISLFLIFSCIFASQPLFSQDDGERKKPVRDAIRNAINQRRATDDGGDTSQTSKPNIVVIMTDNQGFGDLGCYGGVRAETPRIDDLAAQGVMFLDFQVEPVCTPTRAAFQTGRMPVRSGTDGYVEPGQPGGLHPM